VKRLTATADSGRVVQSLILATCVLNDAHVVIMAACTKFLKQVGCHPIMESTRAKGSAGKQHKQELDMIIMSYPR